MTWTATFISWELTLDISNRELWMTWQMIVMGDLETYFQLVRVTTGHMTSMVKLHAIINNTGHLLSVLDIIYMPDRSFFKPFFVCFLFALTGGLFLICHSWKFLVLICLGWGFFTCFSWGFLFLVSFSWGCLWYDNCLLPWKTRVYSFGDVSLTFGLPRTA